MFVWLIDSFGFFWWFGWFLVGGGFVVSGWGGGGVAAGTNLSLFSLSQQREQQDKAAEMGHRFPGRAGRQPH